MPILDEGRNRGQGRNGGMEMNVPSINIIQSIVKMENSAHFDNFVQWLNESRETQLEITLVCDDDNLVKNRAILATLVELTKTISDARDQLSEFKQISQETP